MDYKNYRGKELEPTTLQVLDEMNEVMDKELSPLNGDNKIDDKEKRPD